MDYIGPNSGSGMTMDSWMWAILGIALIVHFVFVLAIYRMASEKEQNGAFWAVFAFLLPEVAFILLYLKDGNTHTEAPQTGASGYSYYNPNS